MAKIRPMSPGPQKRIEMSHYQQYHQISAHSRRVTTVGMCVIMLLAPAVAICIWHSIVNLDGSAANFWKHWKTYGLAGLHKIWPMPSLYGLKLIVGFGVLEALLQLYVPGERCFGPISPAGYRALYKKNGFACYMITLFVYYFLYKEKYFNPAVVYDHYGEILSTLNIVALIIVFLLYLKGHTWASSSDWGSSGNLVVDFYWGMELYPRIGRDFDIKTFTNCRLGMMGWAIVGISFCAKQIEAKGKLSDSLLVSVTLMLVHITKFFWWESGYWNSLDISHDRAGFYNIWGHLFWVPAVYTTPALYLVSHPFQLGKALSVRILAAGLVCIWVTYDCDQQRQVFRESNGKERVWRRIPSKIIAHYHVERGEHKQSLLLVSGWWGIARHFHYLPEIGAAFFWTLPAGFAHLLPYFYTIYLTLFLIDRVERDDRRCNAKYTKFWEAYKKKVPYKIIPHIY